MQSMNCSIQVTLQGERAQDGNKHDLTQQLYHFDQVSQLLYISIILWEPVLHIWKAPKTPCQNILSCHNLERIPTGILAGETRDAAKLPTVLGQSHNKERP